MFNEHFDALFLFTDAGLHIIISQFILLNQIAKYVSCLIWPFLQCYKSIFVYVLFFQWPHLSRKVYYIRYLKRLFCGDNKF